MFLQCIIPSSHDFFFAARFANEFTCWQRPRNVLQKIFVKELISVASYLALLPKNLSCIVTEKSRNLFYADELQC